MVNTRKALKKKMRAKQENEMDKAVKAIGEIYKRYGNPGLVCNRRKLGVDDKFRNALMLRFPEDPNPVLTMIRRWTGKDDNFISLYRYGKSDLNSGAVLSYNLGGNNYYYMVLGGGRIRYDEAKVIYGYPSIINNMIVKGEFEKLKKCVDLFCKSLTKKE